MNEHHDMATQLATIGTKGHPLVMFLASICTLVSAYIVPLLNNIYTWQIPVVFMQGLQCLAWIVTIILGLTGLYTFYVKTIKPHIGKLKNKKK